jgi:imidazolonepropionase-like amidohydrolase
MLRTMKVLAFGFILLPAHFPAQAKTVPRAVLIEHVTVIDGTGGPPVRNVDVLVQEGRIRAVAEGMKAPPHVRVMRSRGKFLIPGLIDMHAHVAYLDWATRDGRPFGTYDRATSERTLQLMLAWGITTVRNPAAPTLEGVELRDDVAAAKIQGPRIFTAGEILNRAARLRRARPPRGERGRHPQRNRRPGLGRSRFHQALRQSSSRAGPGRDPKRP